MRRIFMLKSSIVKKESLKLDANIGMMNLKRKSMNKSLDNLSEMMKWKATRKMKSKKLSMEYYGNMRIKSLKKLSKSFTLQTSFKLLKKYDSLIINSKSMYVILFCFRYLLV